MIARAQPRSTYFSEATKPRKGSSLASYVPRIIIETAASNGWEARWSSTLQGSLLIADVSGFTRLADMMAPYGTTGAERLSDILNTYYRRVLRIVRRFEGGTLRFGGDSLVALFQNDEHAGRAAACSAAIHASLLAARPLPRTAGGGRLRVSCGVHSGAFALVSGGRPEQGLHFGLLGRDVATAVSAQDAAAPGETLLTSATAVLAGLPALEPVGSLLRLPAYPIGTVTGLHDGIRAPVRSVKVGLDARTEAESYLDPLLAARLSSRALDERFGEHRPAVLLFVQIDGAHAVVDAGAGDGIQFFDRVVTAVATATRRRGGVLLGCDPTSTGAKFLAVFGLLQSDEADRRRACLATLELRSSLNQLPGGVTWRAGINAGVVFVGDLGAFDRRDYTVLGDPVNVAARLAAGAAAGQIVAHAGLEPYFSRVARTEPLPPCWSRERQRH